MDQKQSYSFDNYWKENKGWNVMKSIKCYILIYIVEKLLDFSLFWERLYKDAMIPVICVM